MTTVAETGRERWPLKADGIVRQSATHRTLDSELTYNEANAGESARREIKEPHRQESAGGRYEADCQCSVYRIDW